MVRPLPDDKVPIAAFDTSKLNPKWFRPTMPYDAEEAAGTIIVGPGQHYANPIGGEGSATRYGTNVGRQACR